MSKTPILSLDDCSIEFYPGESRAFYAVVDAHLDIGQGEIVGLVGESGCGKSLTSMAIVDLLPSSATAGGTVTFDGRQFEAGSDELSNLRGQSVGVIFQEPMSALDPVYTVFEQLSETLRVLRDLRNEDRIRQESIRLLERVQLDRPEQRLESYPHQLSGGQRQRVMIALALSGEPELLIADEPTTALDVTLEAGIMDLFADLANDGLGVLLISHDLSLVAEVSDRIIVMYSGYTVDSGPSQQIIERPQHPYTRGLVKTSKSLGDDQRNRLPVIPGEVPDPKHRPTGCPFHPRCDEKEQRCEEKFPEIFEPVDSIRTACWAREGGPYRNVS